MPLPPRASILITLGVAFFLALAVPSLSQQIPPAKKPTVGPPAPQSTHFPILLLLQAPDDSWSLRIGQKGPERMDRSGYPPIPLEPAEVSREGNVDAWIYRAKDAQTGAAVAVHIARQPCPEAPGADAVAKAKFVFTASVEHAQIGALQGCGRIAAELFPRINNQLTPEDDEEPKPKTPPPTITKFKAPVDVAYIGATDKMIVKRGVPAKAVPGKVGYELCLSHDGRKLLFTRDEQPAPLRTINEFDFTTGQTKELVRGEVHAAFWSLDDSQIVFLENVSSKWQLWKMPADATERASLFYPGEVKTLEGWVDAHTLLASDLQTLLWIADDGIVRQSLSVADLYGKDQFRISGGNTIRVHPVNGDLLLVSAEVAGPLPAPVTVNDTAFSGQPQTVPPAKPAKKEEGRPEQALFLYEIRTKRRVILSSQGLTCNHGEWSRDGLQIFFTGREGGSKASPVIYKMFWDGTSQTKYREGSELVIGE